MYFKTSRIHLLTPSDPKCPGHSDPLVVSPSEQRKQQSLAGCPLVRRRLVMQHSAAPFPTRDDCSSPGTKCTRLPMPATAPQDELPCLPP